MQVPEEGNEVIAYIPSLLSPTIDDRLNVTDGMILVPVHARAMLASLSPQSV